MNGKRLALAALVVALIVAVLGGPGNSTGQSEPAPGRAYGGVKDNSTVWLRLDQTRRQIAAIEIPWGVDPKRCSKRMGHLSGLYAGYNNFDPISVSAAGKFTKTVVDRYSDQGGRYEEHQAVNGTITGGVATGSISGRVKIEKPNGQVVRCTFGPQRWRVAD